MPTDLHVVAIKPSARNDGVPVGRRDFALREDAGEYEADDTGDAVCEMRNGLGQPSGITNETEKAG